MSGCLPLDCDGSVDAWRPVVVGTPDGAVAGAVALLGGLALLVLQLVVEVLQLDVDGM